MQLGRRLKTFTPKRLSARRAYGSASLRSAMQTDFCNSIGTNADME
jgi:hypothetical protein